MKNLIRFLYRIFIKNRLIRWSWLMALAVYGVYYATEHGIIKTKYGFSKTIFEVNPAEINNLTIRQNEEEMTFIRTDSDWLAVKNNITVQIVEDSIADILNLIKKIESIKIKEDKLNAQEQVKPQIEIIITDSANKNNTISIFNTEKDTFSGNILTYIKRPNERLLHGVKGNWPAILIKNFNNFRDKTLLNNSIMKANRMEFRNRVDTSIFMLKDTNWVYADNRYRVLQDDFKDYLKWLSQLRGGVFYDSPREFKERKNIENQIVIHMPSDSSILTAYRLSRAYALHSTLNNETIFKIDSLNNIFKNIKQFIRLKQNRGF